MERNYRKFCIVNVLHAWDIKFCFTLFQTKRTWKPLWGILPSPYSPPPPIHASCFPESPLASMPRSHVTFVDWLVDWLGKSIINYAKYILLLINNAWSTLKWIMNYYYKLSCKYDGIEGMGKCAWEYWQKLQNGWSNLKASRNKVLATKSWYCIIF